MKFILVPLLAIGLAGLTAHSQTITALFGSISHPDPVEEWKKVLPKITVGTNSLWLVQGDMLMDRDELNRFANTYVAAMTELDIKSQMQRIQLHESVPETQGLPFDVVRDATGKGSRWHPGKVLTYAIDKSTFARDQDYAALTNSLVLACSDWESVCGVEFHYLCSLDTQKTELDTTVNSNLVFLVQARTNEIGIFATSFFPYNPPSRRILIVYPKLIGASDKDRRGMCRHEVGHVLGFAHEQDSIFAGPGCDSWKDPNPANIAWIGSVYDPQSVMHYQCGDNTNSFYEFSQDDKQAAQIIYGASFSRQSLAK